MSEQQENPAPPSPAQLPKWRRVELERRRLRRESKGREAKPYTAFLLSAGLVTSGAYLTFTDATCSPAAERQPATMANDDNHPEGPASTTAASTSHSVALDSAAPGASDGRVLSEAVGGAAAPPAPAPALAKPVAAKLATAESELAKSRWEEAERTLLAVRELLDAAPIAETQHPDLVALGQRYAAAKAQLARFDADLFEALYRAIMVDAFEEPRGLSPSDAAEWEIEEAARRTRRIAKRFHVSQAYAERVYREGPLLDRIAKQAAIEEEKDRERRRALEAKCGAELMTNWSGEPVAVREHLNRTLHDRRSLTDLSCNGPWLTPAHCWVTNCTYRAKNVMGASVLAGQKFYVARNNVTRAEDL
jgi:hypothetical protein